MNLKNCFRSGKASCGAKTTVGPRDRIMNVSTNSLTNLSNISEINAPPEAVYTITQIVLIGTIGKYNNFKLYLLLELLV